MENVNEKLEKNQKRITMILFIIYLVVLAWIILFKMEFTFKNLPNIQDINFIPFAGSTIINNEINLWEIYMNVVAFIPFGVYLAMLKPNWNVVKLVTPIALTSLLIEILQYVFSIGATDITDFIGNTLGGLIGVVIYLIAYKLFKTNIKTNKFFNIIALIGTVGFVGLIGLIVLANL